MAVGKKVECRKFITTEPLGKSGETAEQKVWDAARLAFADRDCIAYWRYPIFSKVGEFRKEPDILIADLKLGLTIIEVKSIVIDQIVAINGHKWEFQNFYTTGGNPYQQAENQLFAILGYCDREMALRDRVRGRAIVALPLITQHQWHEKQFNKLPSCPPIIFKDDLESDLGLGTRDWELGTGEVGISSRAKQSLIQIIEQITPVIKGNKLSDEQWKLLQAVISGTPIFRPPPRKFYLGKTRASGEESNSIIHNSPSLSLLVKGEQKTLNPIPRAEVLAKLQNQLLTLDLQQEHIGKEIPPGPQRIRGIAGSGKTVLLCQKAAIMHLKHPDWDIALVFFSRSLYETIIEILDKYLRRFSYGEIGYNQNNAKLRAFHAWGAKNQPGLYSTLCRAAGVWSLSVNDTEFQQPNEALAYVCSHLLKSAKIPQIFDAILIDEGQDLIVNDELKFEGKQPFYWMAYQALRPVNSPMISPEIGGFFSSDLRRLIWAYDEAQSLESLNIPTASELFGDDLGHLVSGEYGNGIKKTEVMHKCYRTPGPILTAAHGIGMGLLRWEGMLTGITRVEDWEAIGYEVMGDNLAMENLEDLTDNSSIIGTNNLSIDKFKNGQKITLYRPSKNSPNLVPELWGSPVLEFQAYHSRIEELTALADNILYNLKVDSLRPSREILVIVLGSSFEAMELETYVANFLMERGIDVYIPSTPECNILKPDKESRDPNRFWCEGGVTVSRIHRAKGNEADMVYVIGFDNVAKDESNLSLRNQLFVALTRAKGWLRLSGIGAYPMYEEMWRVMESGDTFSFTFKRKPKREISVTDTGEILRRYGDGDRNFQGINLAGVELVGVNLQNANLIGANLQDADLRNAKLDGVRLVIANLSEADLSGASLRKAKLVGAILNDVQLNHADLSRADLSDVQLMNGQLVGAILKEANLSGADLSGANLQGANLEAVNFSDVNLTGAIMPDGTIFSGFI
ncbi:pentapeptide repeat-containing protein [Kamptonema sp. UHCC 0994]|nr:pentapeptide repeat-containing protein [Kamptonema sp. UHCC 0994]MDF0556053.1 pentapeptide repeat-containing protein [Kamptonema sp. UHCC 0994]